MAKRKRKGSVRTASGKQAERILENARYLAEHPEHAVPTCQGRCPLFCGFKRGRKGVDKALKVKEDADKLRKRSRGRGDPLGQAYATILRLALADKGKLEYLQNMKTPRGTVPIAPWGKAPAMAQVGMQHRHDPQLRILMAAPFVRDGDAVYATTDGLVCAHDGTPPDETLDAIISSLGLTSVSPALARCPHVTDDWTTGAYLEVSWPGAGVRFRTCEQCIHGNTLNRIQAHVVTRSILDIVDVRVQLPRLVDPTGGEVPDVEAPVPGPVLRNYGAGSLSDEQLLAEARKARASELSTLSDPMVVLGNEVYRPPFETLVQELDAQGVLKRLLDAALERLQRPVVLEHRTGLGLLHALWAAHGEAALEALAGEPGADLFDPDASPQDLERLVGQVGGLAAQQRLASRLPVYASVPAPVDLADRVARANKVGGKQGARQLLRSAPSRRHVAMAYALVRALDLPSPSWTVGSRDKDMAENLVALVEKVLEAEGDAYHDALVELQRATGSTNLPEREDA